MRTWTPEARKAQAEAIRRWQPWNNATGPKTQVGKSRTRLNAQKHGRYNAEDRARHRELKSLLIRQREFLKSFRLMLRVRKTLKTTDQTIIKRILLAQAQSITTDLNHWCDQRKHTNDIQSHDVVPLPDGERVGVRGIRFRYTSTDPIPAFAGMTYERRAACVSPKKFISPIL